SAMVPYQPIHYLATQKSDVAYQDGKETRGGATKTSASQANASGLTTWGVFGPILSTVLLDAAQSSLAWSHWEQSPDGVRAVFRYAVPKAKSHYEVVYCCVAEQAGLRAANEFQFRKLEGYHGEIAVDPATGTIRRLTLQAELKADDPVVKADIMVQYGPVEIGGRTYTCPLRSVSSSRAESVQVDPNFHFSLANQLQPLKKQIADTTFENYHVFRAETRVLTAAETSQEMNAAPAQPAATPSSSVTPAAAAATASASPAASEAPAPASAESATAASTPAPPPAPPTLAPAAEASTEPEIEATPATGLPEVTPTAREPLPNTGFILRTTTRLVEVALVATDKKGHPITDLKPDELEIYDNGRKETLKDFTQAGADVLTAPASAPAQQAAVDEGVSTNRPPAGTAAAIQQDSGNTTVLMIDAAHVAFSDLNYACGEMLRFLKTVPQDERVGLYILRSYGFQVLLEPTLDHAEVAGTLAKWMPSAQDLMHAQDEEQRNRQQIDWVHRASDLAYVNGNGEGAGSDPSMSASGSGAVADAVYPPDAALRPMGDRPEEFALHLLVGVGRHLAAIPGHKTLVWIASDNVLADWNSSMVGQEDNGNRSLDQPSLRARETLNEAHVSIYPLDVSQLETAAISADLGNRNVQSLAPALPGETVPPPAPTGRYAAQMHADTHPIQPAFRELAEATGGRALRRAGDIAAELSSIVADGRAAYLLSFSPDTQADGKYHVLTVKCLRKGVTLRYRNGYLYSEEPATMKDRFREAVWTPRDESEIGLTAATVSASKGPAVRLNIAAADLQLAEQNGRWLDHVDVFLVIRDDSALHAAIAGRRLGLALKPATYQRDMKEGLTVEESLPRLAPGALLRLIVIDENSRRIGSVTVDAGQGSVSGETATK
ncbi:MAG TPA: VWA domain-containing protein, partial [Terracidiphilus sp.]|nr:VWA domain-containing protein [Terracidiphilus sp.]